MTRTRKATLDPTLSAMVMSRQPLYYAEGSDADEDRPEHVRAASSLAWIRDEIALVQDDANFVALLHPERGNARAVALPRGEAGLRQFDDHRGNKKYKLDLEACAALSDADGPMLLAFGSGSKKRRRRIALVDRWHDVAPRVTLVEATSLYERLEAEHAFAGSDMNIEGALVDGEVLRFFARGNGAPRDGRRPLDATCEIPLDALLAYLRDGARTRPPSPAAVQQYDLGAIEDVMLGFTDATLMGDHVLYSAAAEASKDSITDGAVTGSAIGVISPDGRTRYARLTDHTGRPLRDKVEGLVLSRTTPSEGFLVVDPDDAGRPSELCLLKLDGSWGD
jgi:hypothetical protein